jgi:hypothetical protein
MLFYKGSHIHHEKRNFKISLLCLLPFRHAIWNNFGGKFNGQQKKYGILYSKENHQNVRYSKESLAENYLIHFIFFPPFTEFLLSLPSFLVDVETFQINSHIHSINTRYRSNLHVRNTNLSKYQKRITISLNDVIQ